MLRKLSPFWLCSIAVTLLTIFLLPYRNGFFLRWMDDMSLFDSSSGNVKALMDYPGGILQLAGSYLTQFMFYPWLGSCLLIILWAGIVALAIKAFRLQGHSSLLAFTLPLALLASILNMDEAWITIYSKGYIFSQSLGVIVSLSIFLAYRYASSCAVRCIVMAISLTSFPLFGFYSLLAWLLSAITETVGAFATKRYQRLLIVAAGLLSAVAIPLLYYHLWNGTWAEKKGIYLKGLPDFMLSADDIYLWWPFIVLTAALILLSALSFMRIATSSSRKTLMFSTGILLAFSVWCGACSTKTEQLRAMVLMQHYMQLNNWNRIVAIMNNCREQPSYEMTVIAKFADNMTGRESSPVKSDDVNDGDNENYRKKTSFIRTSFLTVPLSYYIGRPNLSYRWAMEHSVKFGKRAFYLKYMMKCTLLNGDFALAQRYNDMLARTLFHRQWASRYQRFIDNPSLMKDDPEFAAIPANTLTDTFF